MAEKAKIKKVLLEKCIYDAEGNIAEINKDVNDNNYAKLLINTPGYKITNGNFEGFYIVDGKNFSTKEFVLVPPKQIVASTAHFFPRVFDDNEMDKILSGEMELYSFDADLAMGLLSELSVNYVLEYCMAIAQNKKPISFNKYAESVSNFPENAYADYSKMAWLCPLPRKLSVAVSKFAKDYLGNKFKNHSNLLDNSKLAECQQEVGRMVRSYIEEKQEEMAQKNN